MSDTKMQQNVQAYTFGWEDFKEFGDEIKIRFTVRNTFAASQQTAYSPPPCIYFL